MPFGEYQENWALVLKEGYYGFIDQLGEVVVKPVYKSINETIKALKLLF